MAGVTLPEKQTASGHKFSLKLEQSLLPDSWHPARQREGDSQHTSWGTSCFFSITQDNLVNFRKSMLSLKQSKIFSQPISRLTSPQEKHWHDKLPRMWL